ncbi:MAG: hypothetical protein AB7I12_04160 [Steroidobacteraceae bacterium]
MKAMTPGTLLMVHMFRSVLVAVVISAVTACSTIPQANDNAESASLHAPANFNGVWETIDISLVKWPNEDYANYTDLILKRVEDYKKIFHMTADESGKLCYYRGMPWVMLNKARNFPTEIYQTDDRVILFVELFDTHRNIHIDQKGFPENSPRSANGYSIAHWEGSTLVIETRNLTGTYRVSSVHRSEEAYMMERWSLRQDPVYGEVLDIDFTVNDPVVYRKPVKAHTVLKRSPQGTVVGGYNCPDALWQTFIDNYDSRESPRDIFIGKQN